MVGFASKRAAAEGRWQITLEEDNGDLIVPLPDDLLDQLGWRAGDTINWKDMGDGSWQLINLTIGE